MKRKVSIWARLAAFMLALMAVQVMGAPHPDGYADILGYDATVKGLGSFEVFTQGGTGKYVFSIRYFRDGSQRDEHEYISYGGRKGRINAGTLPPTTQVNDCVVELFCAQASVKETLYLLPFFDMSRGFYLHEDVVRLMPKWLSIYKLAPEREYAFRFVPDVVYNRTLIYLEGSLLGALDGVKAVTDLRAVAAAPNKVDSLSVLRKGTVTLRKSDMVELLPIANRVHPLLKEGASMSIAPGRQVINGIPMTVWSPEQSIDQGQHYQTTTKHDEGWNPITDSRTPWNVGTEYMQWRVIAKPWRYAYILCADIPQDGKEAYVGTQMELLGHGCNSGNSDFVATRLSDDGKNPDIAKVGTLTYQKDGQAQETPLYLVRHLLNYTTLGPRVNNKLAIDFELVGAGTWSSFPRSSVQVFGVSLMDAPFTFAVNNPIRGNVFELGGEARRAGFDLQAMRNNVKGTYTYDIYDPYFKPVKSGKKGFFLEKEGMKYHQSLDLSEFPVGWYGMMYRFYDEDGKEVTYHESSFTVLASDDREAGYESPYAGWPHKKGGHGNNPDPVEVLEMMRKIGFRKTWHTPYDDEESMAPWKVTYSALCDRPNPPRPQCKTRAEFDAYMDGVVALYKDQKRRFPHVQVIQLLHEQGGRDIAPEVAGLQEPVRGEYKGWDFDNPDTSGNAWGLWEVFFCTEFAKRMRKEFPGMRIMVGNGSCSSEKIASLVRRGFDLNLVDQLGIESKGFGSMPEFNGNRESPGMLWALRETGRVFGYDHLTLNACNEYVFRAERDVLPEWPVRKIMRVTDYTLRDFLISLGHGCDIICTGHMEDSVGSYYNTNWGAGGQCKFYPYSYPKRMFTGLAVLTRVLDKPVFSRRLPTGEITAYALEFKRDRKVKDFAYALWTPRYDETLEIVFPAGTSVRFVETFGKETVLPLDGRNAVKVAIGSSPVYVIASSPADSAKVIARETEDVPEYAEWVELPQDNELIPDEEDHSRQLGGWAAPSPVRGKFNVKTVDDPELKCKALDFELVKENPLPDILFEYTALAFPKPIKFNLKKETFGLMVRGNSSYGQIMLIARRKFKEGERVDGPWWLAGKSEEMKQRVLAGKENPFPLWLGSERSYIAFDGWQYMPCSYLIGEQSDAWQLQNAGEIEITGILVGSARKALDPLEMADVTGNLRIGHLVRIPREPPNLHNDQKEKADDNMRDIDDKNL